MKSKISWSVLVLLLTMTVQIIWGQTTQNLDSNGLKTNINVEEEKKKSNTPNYGLTQAAFMRSYMNAFAEDCYCKNLFVAEQANITDRLYVAQSTGEGRQTVDIWGAVGIEGHLEAGQRNGHKGIIHSNGRFETIQGDGSIGLVLSIAECLEEEECDPPYDQAPYIMWDPITYAEGADYMHAVRQYRNLLEFSSFTSYPHNPLQIMVLEGESGNIGIGKSNPSQKLDVTGAIVVGDTTENYLLAGTIRWNKFNFEGFNGYVWKTLDVQATSGGGWTEDAENNTVDLTNSGRNVTIGATEAIEKLNVDGAIKLGDSSVNPAAGTIRWNGNFQGYNGSDWINFGGASGTGDFWSLNGNADTTPGTNFLGTTDDQPLEIKAYNQHALRIEPSTESNMSPNLIGGWVNNSVALDVNGGTIGGGGAEDSSNIVSGNYGTVGGGINNKASGLSSSVVGGNSNISHGHYSSISGGQSNEASAQFSFVGGGSGNSASGYAATVSGGNSNSASGSHSTIAGGENNDVAAAGSSVFGGSSNIAEGLFSTVAGGFGNLARGNYSFAAGYLARTQSNGTFIWADTSSEIPFVSIEENVNQFLIRAAGGVGIGTSNPKGALDVSSTTGGFVVPRMSTIQRNNLMNVENGTIIYNTTENQFNFYENGEWVTKQNFL